MIRKFVSSCALVVLLAGCAADLDTADNAYKQGDYKTARAHWDELARRGFPEAETKLGEMKMTGTGVPADPKGAVRLFEHATREK